jgi:hypothetical protein
MGVQKEAREVNKRSGCTSDHLILAMLRGLKPGSAGCGRQGRGQKEVSRS